MAATASQHWLHGSIAEELSRAARLPTLFVPSTARGFVDQSNGNVHLSRVLVPIDHSPQPLQALDILQNFIAPMPTAGHQGFLDALRGSTTERALRHAPCPVLAVPVK